MNRRNRRKGAGTRHYTPLHALKRIGEIFVSARINVVRSVRSVRSVRPRMLPGKSGILSILLILSKA